MSEFEVTRLVDAGGRTRVELVGGGRKRTTWVEQRTDEESVWWRLTNRFSDATYEWEGKKWWPTEEQALEAAKGFLRMLDARQRLGG